MGLWLQTKWDKILKAKAQSITAASAEIWPSKDDLAAKGKDPYSIVTPDGSNRSDENCKLRLPVPWSNSLILSCGFQMVLFELNKQLCPQISAGERA